jgi:hypothetical protein
MDCLLMDCLLMDCLLMDCGGTTFAAVNIPVKANKFDISVVIERALSDARLFHNHG